MRNFVIINGVNSNTINGLGINELPPITKPEMRNIREEIDGRDGDITTNLGYSAYDKTITIGLFGTGYDINDIVAFFNGEGTIVFSNEQDKYYNFKILNQIDYESLQKFRTASITFHCQPFKYPLNETPLEIEYDYIEDEGETLTLNNTGNATLKLDLKGNTSQSGTPTPTSPIPVSVVSGDNDVVVCGKNLLPINSFSPTGAGNILTNYPLELQAGKYTISCNLNITSTKNMTIRFDYEDGTNTPIDIYAGTTQTTFTLSKKSTKITWYVREVYTMTNVMLERGETKTTFEPYQSQTYEVDLPVENIATSYMGSGNGYYNYNYDNSKVSKTMTLSFMSNFSATNTTVYARPSIDGTLYTLGNIPTITSGKKASLTFTLTDTQISEIKANTGGFFQIYDPDVVFTENYVSEVQLEPKSKANSYTEYGTTPIELCKIGTYQDYFAKNSGKNLEQGMELGGINESGVLYPSTTTIRSKNYDLVEPNTQYIISLNGSAVAFTVIEYDESETLLSYSIKTGAFTTSANTRYIKITKNTSIDSHIQLEKGSSATPYEPYGTGQWCKYNAIGKYTFDGTETWYRTGTKTSGNYYFFANNVLNNVKFDSNNRFTGMSNMGISTNIYQEMQGTDTIFYDNTNRSRFYSEATKTMSAPDFKVWLSTHNTNVYYVLATPYLSLIEDNNLIEQLDNIQNAMSYEGTTNIGQVNNDKPFIISAKALEQGTNEVVINNIGNVYSKPLLALEGSGNVDIYLDNTQILKANVEDKMNIDIAQLEAYNPDTMTLLNRQVIGNYNSMTLQPGNNTIRIDGSLDKATITNYTRYL